MLEEPVSVARYNVIARTADSDLLGLWAIENCQSREQLLFYSDFNGRYISCELVIEITPDKLIPSNGDFNSLQKSIQFLHVSLLQVHDLPIEMREELIYKIFLSLYLNLWKTNSRPDAALYEMITSTMHGWYALGIERATYGRLLRQKIIKELKSKGQLKVKILIATVIVYVIIASGRSKYYIKAELRLHAPLRNFMFTLLEICRPFRRRVKRVTQLSADGRAVSGVARLRRRFYAVTRGSNVILVYSASVDKKYRRLPDITHPDIDDPGDIVADARNVCLYVADCKRDCIWRADVDGDDSDDVGVESQITVTRWLSDVKEPRSLSMTGDGNLLVMTMTDGVRVFAPTTGDLVAEVRQPAGVDRPLGLHAVATGDGTFVVSQGEMDDRLQRVVEIDGEGRVLRSYGDERGTGAGQLDRPVHVQMDAGVGGRVFVADRHNRRVLVLDRRLKLERVLLTKDQDDIDRPYCLCLHRDTGQLMVGMWSGNIDVYQVS